MKHNILEYVIRKNDYEDIEEIKELLFDHITNWLDEKQCPVCSDWCDEHAKHCTICDGTRKIYIDYSLLYYLKII